MIHLNKIRALEKLDLTRTEALEWLDMLAQKKHQPWDEVVKKHMATIHKTNCIVCYKDKNGKFSYHRYVDTARLGEIYGFQLSPNWLIALKDEMDARDFAYLKVDMHKAQQNYLHRYNNTGWQVLTKDSLEEYKVYYKAFLESDDAKIFSNCGIVIFGIHYGYPYWVFDEEHNNYQLCYLSGDSSVTQKEGFIRFVQLVCNNFDIAD